jgi:hypothetical protein
VRLRCNTFFVLFWVGLLPISNSMAQSISKVIGPIRVAVGDDTLLHTSPSFLTKTVSCFSGLGECTTPFNYALCSRYGNYISANNDDLLREKIILFPQDTFSLVDTIYSTYSINGIQSHGNPCQCFFSHEETMIGVIVQWSSYWDSMVKVRPSTNTCSFRPNLNGHYLPVTMDYLLFNNTTDSVTFSDWEIKVDSLTIASMAASLNSTPIFSYQSYPLERKIPIVFTVNLADTTQNKIRELNAELTVRVKTPFYDSVFSNRLSIILNPDHNKDTVQQNTPTNDNALKTLQVFPNPSTGLIKVDINAKDSVYDLSLYDLIGNRIQTLDALPLSSGRHQYTLSLSLGIYYLRCESRNGIITKKVVIQ